MSWRIAHTGPARDAVARHEREAGDAKPGRTVLELAAIEATKPVVESAVRHTGLSDLHATVDAQGHHNEDGSGYVSLAVNLHPVAAPAPLPAWHSAPLADPEE